MSASPAPESSKAPVAKTKAPSAPPSKPANVFSNDGSFLERFKKGALTEAEKEKEEREKALARKKALEDRFKNRGKRRAPSTESDSSTSKKKKDGEDGTSTLTAYQREVKRLESRSLKDEGYEMRPMLK
ncbi:hypothetical protein JCM10212_002860 [Sporobolomyces blumeae]